MIHYTNIKQFPSFLYFLSEHGICVTWFKTGTWMIVCEDKCHSICFQGGSKYKTWICNCCCNTTCGNFINTYYFIAPVEQQNFKLFLQFHFIFIPCLKQYVVGIF